MDSQGVAAGLDTSHRMIPLILPGICKNQFFSMICERDKEIESIDFVH